MDEPHIQLIVDQTAVPPYLQTALNRLNARVSIRSLDKARQSGISESADVCVILPGPREDPDVLDPILADASNRACATLVLPGEDRHSRSQEGPADPRRPAAGRLPAERSPDRMSVDELTGRIRALCEIRAPMRRMQEELARLRKRDAELTAGVRRFDEQIQLASELQNDLLPPLPSDTSPLSLSILYLPADRVSGDMYDVSRLDRDRLRISIADATGHGMPAALLTIFVKNLLHRREMVGGEERLIEPDELLRRLNAELLRSNLPQCQCISALNAVFDASSREIRWARGGVPYPILLRPGYPPSRVLSDGGLIGAFEDQTYQVVSHCFDPGDVLLFHTDGLESLFRKQANGDNGHQVDLLNTDWISQLAIDGPEIAFDEIRRLARDVPDSQWYKDDITAVAVTVA